MKVFRSALLLAVLVVLLVLTGSSPLLARKLSDRRRNPWRTDVSYRERLQSWGLYPKVFRYGTTNHHAAIMERKRAELNWLRRIIRENERTAEGRMAVVSEEARLERDYQYEKFKEQHFQKMEQEALEVLWQHR